MENYYQILHLADFAEIELVKAAYRAITKLYHPDVNKNIDTSVIVKINLAYEILGDPQKKASYDRELREFLRTCKADYSYEKSTQESYEARNSQRDTKQNGEKQTSYNADAAQQKSKGDTDAKESETPQTKAGKFAKAVGNGLWTVVDSFLEGARELQKEAENAYYQGSDFDDFTLVRKYMKSSGAKRKGYLKVLLERRLMYEENGELVPSYEFRNIARYM